MMLYQLYKHENGKDCAIYPTKLTRTPEGLLVEFLWVNIVNSKKKYIIDLGKPTVKLFTPEYQEKWKHIGDMANED